jgi:hypothetical protein
VSHVGRRSPRRTQTITEKGVAEIPTKKATKPAKTPKATPKADPKKARKGGKAKTPAVETTPAKKLSQIAAAERVLAEADEPMNCKAMVEAMDT